MVTLLFTVVVHVVDTFLAGYSLCNCSGWVTLYVIVLVGLLFM